MLAPKLEFEQNVVRERLYGQYRSNRGAMETFEEIEKRAPYVRRLIKRHFPDDKTARILDLGCGNAALLTMLRQAGYQNLWGVDNSAEQIANAQGRSVAGVTHADIFQFLSVQKEGSYDVVLTFDVIEHLDREELLGLADEVYRKLSPGGSWIIHTANAEGPFGSRVRYSDLTHEQAFTRDSIVQLTSAAGFRVVDCFEDVPVVHGWKSLIRWSIWKVARSVILLYLNAELGDTGGRAVLSQNLLAVAKR